MRILITGAAGFIGYSLALKILENKKIKVFGIDNLNSYYEISLKKERLKKLFFFSNFKFFKLNIENEKLLTKIFIENKIDYVIHLAAQAGVRHSLKKPETYIQANINGFFNIINLSKTYKIKHFLFASSSSVYGDTSSFPTKENNKLFGESLYASTKIFNENMAYNYSKNYKISITGLRFFTVYGPYGRPDMSMFKFVNCILNGKKIDLFNNGNHYRDFTYIDDVSSAIIKLIKKIPKNKIPFQVINIGSGKSVFIKDMIKIIENETRSKAIITKKPFQIGDVLKTHSSIKKLQSLISGYKPITINKGMKKYLNWHKEYYS